MRVTIELKASRAGNWNICRSHVTLFSDMQLEAAIDLAREMARDEHLRSGRDICVEMPGPVSTILLANYVSHPPPVIAPTMAA